MSCSRGPGFARHAPSWERRATEALRRASSRIHVLAATTPVNLTSELARLESVWQREGPAPPAFQYRPAEPHGALREALTALARRLHREGELGELYAGRALELADEAAVCELAGSADLLPAARRRYGQRDAEADAADALAAAWAASPEGPLRAPPDVRSDDERSPGSLVCRLREELSRRGMPFRVVVRPDVAALAATGDGVVQVAEGRWLSAVDVERTVLHEILGHVAPRMAAARATLGIFAVGTRGGSDDQEGRALALEHDARLLDEGRRRELGRRHLAARATARGAAFVDTVRLLLAADAPLKDALRIAARAHRGGGLAREAVYLPALLRVQAARRADPSCDAVLAAGSVSVEAAPVLAPWANHVSG